MAEIFKNYVATVKASAAERIIVPAAVANQNIQPYEQGGQDYNERNLDSYAQVHSIYISQVDKNRINGFDRYNPANFKSVDLYIRDTNVDTLKIYICYDVRIVPGSPYYIEKNITLQPTQYLCAFCSPNAKDVNIDADGKPLVSINNNLNLNISAGTVLFVDDAEL